MRDNKNREIIVGLVSFIAIILFIFGIGIGNGWNVSDSAAELNIVFPNSGGIKPSAPVHVNGVKRGKVNEIINQDGSVLIKAELDNIEDLKSNASAKILILEITGGKKIEINPGTSTAPFDINNKMKGTTAADLGELIEVVGEVSGDAVSLLRRLDTISVSVNNLLNDDETMNELKSTIRSTNQFIGNANELLNNNKNEIENIINNINSLTTKLDGAYDKYEPEVEEIINQLKSTLKDTKKLFATLDTSIYKVNSIFDDVEQLLNASKSDSSAIYKLFYDKSFTNTLDSAIINLNAVLSQFKEHGVNVNVRLGTRP